LRHARLRDAKTLKAPTPLKGSLGFCFVSCIKFYKIISLFSALPAYI